MQKVVGSIPIISTTFLPESPAIQHEQRIAGFFAFFAVGAGTRKTAFLSPEGFLPPGGYASARASSSRAFLIMKWRRLRTFASEVPESKSRKSRFIFG